MGLLSKKSYTFKVVFKYLPITKFTKSCVLYVKATSFGDAVRQIKKRYTGRSSIMILSIERIMSNV